MFRQFFCLIFFVFVYQFAKSQSVAILNNYVKKNGDTSTLQIQFHNFAGNEILKLDDATYTNELGQSFTVSNFKYYIGKIKLLNENDIAVEVNTYHLIKEDEPETKSIQLHNIPKGIYKSVSFILGVDSIDNCSGAQSGALDPVNGMFWTWNTGYIFLKLEGNAQASKSPGNIFEYHIGGFKSPNNCIRKVNLTFEKPLLIDPQLKNEIHLKADILEILKTPTPLNFSILSSVTDHKNACMVAANYCDMFSILNEHR